MTSIGRFAFENCKRLTSIEIPNSVTSIGSSAFKGTGWYNTQPDGMVYVGKVLYEYKGTMPANTSIIIKEGTLGIGGSAFNFCSGLTTVTIPNSVMTIGGGAFNYCSGLMSVTIGNSVTSIGIHAFNSDNITTVVSLIANPFIISGVFSLNTLMKGTLYVPTGTKETYKKTEGWKDFRYIEEGTDGVASVRAHAVLVKSNEGLLTIEGVNDGTLVSVYGISGLQVGSVISQNGRAVINTGLKPGSVAIVKIGEESVKVVVK